MLFEKKDGKVTLKLTISNLKEEQAIALVNMMKEMERFGYLGHSAYIGFYADGDGSFHPQVKHNLKYSDNELSKFSESSKVYEGHHRINSKETKFPWTDSITLFDFDGLWSKQ